MSEQFIFATIQWGDAGDSGGELFGPWVVREDGSHLDEIREFVNRWRAAEGRTDVALTLWLPTSPEAYDQRVQART